MDHLDFCGRHGRELCDQGLFLIVAEVKVGWTAGWAQVLFCELLEIFEATATVVIRQVSRVTVLDRWVAPDAVLVAQGLALGGAINIADERRGGVSEFLHQLVPSGLQALAVASPWSLKFNEDALASGFLVPVRLGELDCPSASKQGRRENDLERHEIDELRTDAT